MISGDSQYGRRDRPNGWRDADMSAYVARIESSLCDKCADGAKWEIFSEPRRALVGYFCDRHTESVLEYLNRGEKLGEENK